MDSPSRSIGPKTRPPSDPRSRAAGRLDKVLPAAIGGDASVALSITAGELLAESAPVVQVLEHALGEADGCVVAHWRVHQLLRRSRVYQELLDALVNPNPVVRAAAARICGAARIPDAVLWLSDLLDDPNRKVREAAVRSLAQLGGRRVVELLTGSSDRIPLHRLAISLAQAAGDLDIEALMRRPVSEHAAVATVMACGIRRDTLRISPLLGIAHDRRWPVQVRLAACKAVAMIGNRVAADGLRRLAESDPDPAMQKAAVRAHKRLLKRAVKSSA